MDGARTLHYKLKQVGGLMFELAIIIVHYEALKTDWVYIVYDIVG